MSNLSTEAPRLRRVLTAKEATSFAALTYIGFDGVTTLAEEVKEPRRTVPVATVSASSSG